MGKKAEQTFQQKRHIDDKYMKKWSTSLVIRDMKIKS